MIGAAVESAMNVYCEGCGSRLRTRFDTNGNGTTIELVRPCETCTRRRSRFVVGSRGQRARGYQERSAVCRQCSDGFTYAGPGVVPHHCARCRREKKLTCRDCGEDWFTPRSKGRYHRACPECRGGGA